MAIPFPVTTADRAKGENDMNLVVLDHIPHGLHYPHLVEKLVVGDKAEARRRVKHLLQQASEAAAPKAVFKIARAQLLDGAQLMIDDETFCSQLLAEHMSGARCVFPFVATCGREIWDWAQELDGILVKFWGEVMMQEALNSAVACLEDHLQKHYQSRDMLAINPGSFPGWPLQEQRRLFRLLNGGAEQIGVKLTERSVMIPLKSVSGLYFPTDTARHQCELCPRSDCRSRQAPHRN